MDKKQILKGLNEFQEQAVSHIKGPVLIVAGAGSGKTKTLTHRLAYLIASKVDPKKILMVTFTNKAALEMKERVAKILGKDNNDSFIGTFHKLGVMILRETAQFFDWERNFTIFDQKDSRQIIKNCLKDLDLPKEQFSPAGVGEEISRAKNLLISSKEYEESASNFFQKKVAKVYSLYEEKLSQNKAFDFDDLIFKTVMVLKKKKDILEKYQNRWEYLMVDEFQDTNPSQYYLIKLLAKKHRNICVVGDDDQSIYSWRQADISNFLNFEKDWPKTKVIVLGENYRTTRNILSGAQSLIKNNKFRKEKDLYTNNQEGSLIKLIQVNSDLMEADFISEHIEKEGIDYKNFAILYRTNAQSRVVEEAMLKKGIPYQVFAGAKFYDRKEIKDLVAYLRFISNRKDSASLERIINVPARGIGKKKKEVIFQEGSAFDNLDNIKEAKEFKETILSAQKLIEKGAVLVDVINLVIEKTGYKQFLMASGSEGKERWQNVLELLRLAQETKLKGSLGLEEFLERVSLFQDEDQKNDKKGVQLMTLHSAKGLEFKTVFIIGMEEGLIPHTQSQLSPNDLEEERRLAYVGMTRAKEDLFLIFSSRRRIFGGFTSNPPSRFLGEIEPDLFDSFSLGGYNNENLNQEKEIEYYDDNDIEVEEIE